MGMDAEEFWLMPIGLFFDLWACHKQWHGIEKPRKPERLTILSHRVFRRR